MKKIISIRDIISLTFNTYKQTFKKMTPVLWVIFGINFFLVAIESYFDFYAEERIFGGVMVGSFIVFTILYLIAFAYNLIISLGFVRKVSRVHDESFDTKSVLDSGKKIVIPSLWLGLQSLSVAATVLAAVGVVIIGVSLLSSLIGSIVGGILMILLGVSVWVVFIILGVYLGFAQFALYADEKKGLEAIKHSVQIVQGNVLNILAKVFVYYAGIFVLLLGVVGLGTLISVGLYEVAAVDGTAELLGTILLGLVAVAVNVFIIMPVSIIAIMILYRSLQDVYREKSEAGLIKHKYDFAEYVEKSYKIGKWVLILGAIAFIFMIVFLILISF